MIKLLIADDNVPFCESLFSVLTKEKDFKVTGIAHAWQDIEKKYFETQPDLVLLDLNIPGKNGLEIINDLTEKEDKPPKKNIIVVSGDMKYRASLTNVEKVKWIMAKPVKYDNLVDVIRKSANENIFQENQENIGAIVSALLNTLRFPLCKGRKLLEEAIIIAYTKPELLEKTEFLMRIVAKKENYSNERSVRSTIDKLIERTFDRAQDKNIFNILDQFYGEKMTTKEFIISCVLYIHKVIKNS